MENFVFLWLIGIICVIVFLIKLSIVWINYKKNEKVEKKTVLILGCLVVVGVACLGLSTLFGIRNAIREISGTELHVIITDEKTTDTTVKPFKFLSDFYKNMAEALDKTVEDNTETRQ